jgi:hypothetical protein
MEVIKHPEGRRFIREQREQREGVGGHLIMNWPV